MPKEIVGNIPEFTDEGTPEPEEVKEETETPSESSTDEQPAEEEPSESEDTQEPEEEPSEDTEEPENVRQVQGLETEKDKLLNDIQILRSVRRDIKESSEQQKVDKQIEEKIDDLSDIDDATKDLVRRIVKTEGYVSKDKLDKKMYSQVKQEELNKFLNKYPEYKPENDPEDKNWKALQGELGYYKMPDDPYKVSQVLEKARKAISKTPSGRGATDAEKQKLAVAGAGASKGGVIRPSSSKSLTPDKREALSRGGWTEEEINAMYK